MFPSSLGRSLQHRALLVLWLAVASCQGWIISPTTTTTTRIHPTANTHAFGISSLFMASPTSVTEQEQEEETASSPGDGLYKAFADVAWQKLRDASFLTLESVPLEKDMQHNQAVAKGFPPGSQVHMELKALQSKDPSKSPIQYARYALLETKVPNQDVVVDDENNPTLQTQGIQVLNMVIFPQQSQNNDNNKPALPVWGADFVSLPGGKHLLLLDAQPMHEKCQMYQHWATWYEQEALHQQFPWGGDFPPAVQRYVSKHALWTRLATPTSSDDETAVDPVETIQSELMPLFEQHLDLYLQLVSNQDMPVMDPDLRLETSPPSWFDEYLEYRLTNDPARPMLKSLYGEDWTEQALHQVLFPTEMLLSSDPEEATKK